MGLLSFLALTVLNDITLVPGDLVLEMKNHWQIHSEYCVAKMYNDKCIFSKTCVYDCLFVCDSFNPGWLQAVAVD